MRVSGSKLFTLLRHNEKRDERWNAYCGYELVAVARAVVRTLALLISTRKVVNLVVPLGYNLNRCPDSHTPYRILAALKPTAPRFCFRLTYRNCTLSARLPILALVPRTPPVILPPSPSLLPSISASRPQIRCHRPPSSSGHQNSSSQSSR